MKVFISWSGALSKNLAETFRTWLPSALQAVKPYFTPSDIEKGARWNTEITKELEASDVGVLFITRDNIESAWLLYEAGALSKSLEQSKVCPIIFGLRPEDLPGPLRQFQATEFKKDDFKTLMKTINTSLEHKLTESVLDQVFEMWWPKLEEKIKKFLDNEQKPSKTDVPLREDREILEEILQLARLSSRHSIRQNRVSPRLVYDLLKSLEIAHEAINGNTEPEATMKALANMRGPIRYLITKTITDREEKDTLIEGLDVLSFEYEPVDIDDDEVPF